MCRKITLPTVGVVSVAGSIKHPYDDLQDVLLPDAELRRRWQSFQQKMMPQVGKQLSLVGLISEGKAVLTIDYDEWIIYLDGVDLREVNVLNNLACHTAVRVSGRLQYYSTPKTDMALQQQRPPDHFFFDRPQIEIVRTNGRRWHSGQ